jgi:hypothetical protein
MDLELQTALRNLQGNAFSDVMFSINGKRTGRIEPLGTGLAWQAVQSGDLDTQTKYRDIDHGIWQKTNEFNILVRFCCQQDLATDTSSGRTMVGSYVVTVYSRNFDFSPSFSVEPDGSLRLIQQGDTEIPHVRTGRGYISIPATQLQLPGDPAYLTFAFKMKGSGQDEVDAGNYYARDTYTFPNGVLTVSSALHPGLPPEN